MTLTVTLGIVTLPVVTLGKLTFYVMTLGIVTLYDSDLDNPLW